MFPKGTVTAALTLAEKPPVTDQKQSTVVYMVDKTDLQVAVENDRQWRIKRAAIWGCVFLLTVLILVAGTLGAIAILSVHNDMLRTSEPEPSIHESVVDNLLPTHLPKSTKQIKIYDGGLWLTEPVTSDLIDVDYVTSVNDAVSDIVSAPPLTPSSESSSNPDSSSSSSSSEDLYYQGGRNWISSSFPYQGYYMRGGVGDPPWDQRSWDGASVDDPSTTGTSRPSEVSGDGAKLSGDGALSDQEYGGDESGNGSDGDGISDSDDYDDYSSTVTPGLIEVDYVTAVNDAESDIVSAPFTLSSESSSNSDYSFSSSSYDDNSSTVNSAR